MINKASTSTATEPKRASFRLLNIFKRKSKHTDQQIQPASQPSELEKVLRQRITSGQHSKRQSQQPKRSHKHKANHCKLTKFDKFYQLTPPLDPNSTIAPAPGIARLHKSNVTHPRALPYLNDAISTATNTSCGQSPLWNLPHSPPHSSLNSSPSYTESCTPVSCCASVGCSDLVMVSPLESQCWNTKGLAANPQTSIVKWCSTSSPHDSIVVPRTRKCRQSAIYTCPKCPQSCPIANQRYPTMVLSPLNTN